MLRRVMMVAICTVAFAMVCQSDSAQAQEKAYGAVWGGQATRNMERFYHYPYVYYPQNYWSSNYFQSGNSLYHRYPAEMRVPVYNKQWHNYYPTPRRYHWGHQFITDVF